MKKFLFSLLACVAILHGASAQGWIGGLTVGINWGKQKRTTDYLHSNYPTNLEDRTKLDFMGGIRIGRSFGSTFSFIMDITYERNRFITETVDTYAALDRDGNLKTGIWTIEERLSRISFPLLARFTLFGGEEGRGGLTISVGPSFSVGIDDGERSNVFDTGSETFPLAPSEDIAMGESRFDEYKGFNTGLEVGIGAAIPLSGGGDDPLIQLTFDLRKRWGFNDMYTEDRKRYLEATEGVEIVGSKFLRGTYLSVALQISFSNIVR